jgi:hypothetical protein
MQAPDQLDQKLWDLIDSDHEICVDPRQRINSAEKCTTSRRQQL